MNKVPPPPVAKALRAARLDEDALLLRPGQTVYHVYPQRYQADSFNPGLGLARFHPFLDASGQAVAVYYCASTEEGSLCETLFRATAIGSSCRMVPGQRLAGYALAEIRLRQPLQLAHLAGNCLNRLGLTRARLLEPGPPHYPQTTAWAGAIHAAYPGLHGLAWVSRQHDSSTCMVLFGDRVTATWLEPVSTLDLASPAGRLRMDALGQRLGVVITR
jgi:hypothetical protein